MRLIAVLMLAAGMALPQTPTVTDGGVVNLASGVPGQPVAPGSLVAIFGSQLASSLAAANTIPLSNSLADVTSVTFNGNPVPLQFVSPTQINAQVPWETGMGTAAVVVNRGGAASQPVNVQIAGTAPGIFSLTFAGLQAIAINNGDGSLAAPAGLVPGLLSHPATAADNLIIYATGLGVVTPAPTTGANSADTQRTTVIMPTMMVGGVPAKVSFSGLSPLLVGVYQVNIVMPSGVTPGNNVPLQIQTPDATTTDQVTIAVQ